MESENRNIIMNMSKLQEKLESTDVEQMTEKPQEKPKEKKKEKKGKATKLRIKKLFVKKRKKPKNNTNINVNYAKSNCLSRLFFFWPRQIFKISNKGLLTHEDVCNVSKEQSIKNAIEKVQKTFSKYNSNKCKNYSLIVTIFFSNLKLLFFLFFFGLIWSRP